MNNVHHSKPGGYTPSTSAIWWTTDFSKLQISKLKRSGEVEKFPEITIIGVNLF